MTNRKFFEMVYLPSGTPMDVRRAYVNENLQRSSGRVLLLRDHPATAARYFEAKQNFIFKTFLGIDKNDETFNVPGVLGVVSDYVVGREEQAHGSEHDHCMFALGHDAASDADIHDPEGRAKIAAAIDDVITATLEPRPPGDTTYLRTLATAEQRAARRSTPSPIRSSWQIGA